MATPDVSKPNKQGTTPTLVAPVPSSGFVVAGATTAGAAGAAAGSLIGPVGAAIGAVVGAVAGGACGGTLSHIFTDSRDEAYWRQHHAEQSQANTDASFNDFVGAYQSGYETYFVAPEKNEFDDKIAHERYVSRGGHLAWEHARSAALAAWHHARGDE